MAYIPDWDTLAEAQARVTACGYSISESERAIFAARSAMVSCTNGTGSSGFERRIGPKLVGGLLGNLVVPRIFATSLAGHTSQSI